MMLQSCYAVFATSILNSVTFHCFLAHVELEKELFAAWNQAGLSTSHVFKYGENDFPGKSHYDASHQGQSKFRGHAKEEAKQQPAKWRDFLTRKKKKAKKLYLLTFVLKTAAGF